MKNISLNALDSTLDQLTHFMHPLNFANWLLKTEAAFEENQIRLLMEDEEYFSAKSPHEQDLGIVEQYRSRAPIDPKLALEFELYALMGKINITVRNDIHHNQYSNSVQEKLATVVGRVIKKIALDCAIDPVFNPYSKLIISHLSSFERLMLNVYGMSISPEISIEGIYNDEALSIIRKIDKHFGYLRNAPPDLLGCLNDSQYQDFKSALIETLRPDNEVNRSYQFETPDISGEDIRYSFYLFFEEIQGGREVKAKLTEFAINSFKNLEGRNFKVLLKNFSKMPPKLSRNPLVIESRKRTK